MNIRTGDEEQYDSFGLIDSASIRRKHGLNGRLLWVEVKLSDWVFNAIEAKQVLTLHRDYFRLRKPLERRIYEIVRKHCGNQEGWSVTLPLLLKKAGSQSPIKRFRKMIRDLVKHDHLPDYGVSFDQETDMVTFRNRGSTYPTLTVAQEKNVVALRPDTYEQARECAPGWDIYHIEREWREWLREPPRYPDAAFIGFCKNGTKSAVRHDNLSMKPLFSGMVFPTYRIGFAVAVA